MNTNTKHINIFIAYSRKDDKYLDKLRTHFSPLELSGTVKIWYDGEIAPGTNWEEEIKKYLLHADITLLLISANSFNSDYFYHKEMTKALQRHQEEEAIVIPVILSDCMWEITDLKHLQALPKDGKPIDLWTKEDSAYADIVRGVYRNVELIRDRQKAVAEKAAKISTFPTPIQDILRDMIHVKGDTFQMGDGLDDEKPTHTVTLDDFKIGKYPITQAQYKAVTGKSPSEFKGNDKRPVEMVTWHEAQDFIKQLNTMTGEKFRLPTEVEWEFAARGGTKSRGFKYAGSNDINAVAWHWENSGRKGKDHSNYGTNPVGTKVPNELNIHDMSGNVYEWCEDWYDDNYYKNSLKNNPKVSTSKQTFRAIRGGAWGSNDNKCCSSTRSGYLPDDTVNFVGFRLAQTP